MQIAGVQVRCESPVIRQSYSGQSTTINQNGTLRAVKLSEPVSIIELELSDTVTTIQQVEKAIKDNMEYSVGILQIKPDQDMDLGNGYGVSGYYRYYPTMEIKNMSDHTAKMKIKFIEQMI